MPVFIESLTILKDHLVFLVTLHGVLWEKLYTVDSI